MPELSNISLSVSEELNASYLESPRYAYLVAELEAANGRLLSLTCGTRRTLFHLFVVGGASAHRHRAARYGNRRDSSIDCETGSRSLSNHGLNSILPRMRRGSRTRSLRYFVE